MLDTQPNIFTFFCFASFPAKPTLSFFLPYCLSQPYERTETVNLINRFALKNMDSALPDSITEWGVLAISASHQTGRADFSTDVLIFTQFQPLLKEDDQTCSCSLNFNFLWL